MDDKNPSSNPWAKEERPSKPRFAISILECYVCFAIVVFACGFLYPAVEAARELRSLPSTLPEPFDVNEWSRGYTLTAIVILVLAAPLFPCGLLLLIRTALPDRWKKYIVWRDEGRAEPVRPTTSRDRWICLGVLSCLCAAILLALIYENTLHDPLPIPEPPDERNRVEHPDGFSIIFPEGWETVVVPADPERLIRPTNALIGHPAARKAYGLPQLSVMLCEERPAADGFSSVEFQGRPAFEWFDASGGANTIWMEYVLVFEREGRWFEFSFHMPNSTALNDTRTETLPPQVKQYANTFQTHAKESQSDTVQHHE